MHSSFDTVHARVSTSFSTSHSTLSGRVHNTSTIILAGDDAPTPHNAIPSEPFSVCFGTATPEILSATVLLPRPLIATRIDGHKVHHTANTLREERSTPSSDSLFPCGVRRRRGREHLSHNSRGERTQHAYAWTWDTPLWTAAKLLKVPR